MQRWEGGSGERDVPHWFLVVLGKVEQSDNGLARAEIPGAGLDKKDRSDYPMRSSKKRLNEKGEAVFFGTARAKGGAGSRRVNEWPGQCKEKRSQ